MLKLMRKITHFTIIAITLAIILGVIFKGTGLIFSPYTNFLLGMVFFFSALKIDLKEVKSYLKQYRKILIYCLFALIVTPIIFYYLGLQISQEFAVAFLILSAMPAGMTTPILSKLFGGKAGLSLILTVATSLLAVFTIPLLFKLLTETSININFFSMFLSLVKIIIVPFILAELVKYFFKKEIEKRETTTDFFAFSSIVIANFAVGAKQSELIISGIKNIAFIDIFLLFSLCILLHFAGYFFSPWKEKEERISSITSFAYVNIILAIYLVMTYFNDAKIITLVVLALIPWVLLMRPFELIAKKLLVKN